MTVAVAHRPQQCSVQRGTLWSRTALCTDYMITTYQTVSLPSLVREGGGKNLHPLELARKPFLVPKLNSDSLSRNFRMRCQVMTLADGREDCCCNISFHNTHKHTHRCTHTRTHARTHAHTHTRAHAHTRTHAHTHTHTVHHNGVQLHRYRKTHRKRINGK